MMESKEHLTASQEPMATHVFEQLVKYLLGEKIEVPLSLRVQTDKKG